MVRIRRLDLEWSYVSANVLMSRSSPQGNHVSVKAPRGVNNGCVACRIAIVWWARSDHTGRIADQDEFCIDPQQIIINRRTTFLSKTQPSGVVMDSLDALPQPVGDDAREAVVELTLYAHLSSS